LIDAEEKVEEGGAKREGTAERAKHDLRRDGVIDMEGIDHEMVVDQGKLS